MTDSFPALDTLPQTRQELVASKLREAILRGQLKPGQRLDLEEIANLLRVSRSPVREAVRTLEAEGLVQVIPHRGVLVRELSPEEQDEIYIIRSMLEGMAARIAAPRIQAPSLQRLEGILREMDETDDPDRWIQLNSQFHGTIYQAANRPRLVALIDQLRNTSAPYIRQIISTSEYRLQAVAEHRAIYQTCVHRDGLAAEQETQKHLMAVCARILQPNLPVQADSQRPQDGAGAS